MKTETIQGTISDIAFGGKGIMRHEGLVIFIPFTAIGDVVSVRITKKKSSYAEGEIEQILIPSPNRITPLCPYFGTCGGCQLQHIDYQAQLDYKKRSVEDALKRIGKLSLDFPLEIVPAHPIWGYRRHVQLNLRASPDGYIAGYVATDNTTLIPIAECPIFTDKGDPLFAQVQEVVQALKCSNDYPARMILFKVEPSGFLLDFQFTYVFPENMEKVFKGALQRYPNWKGISASAKNETRSYGNVQAELLVDDLLIRTSPRAFIQNHPEQSLQIYREIVKEAADAQISTLLDLYCGIGISSLLLSKQGISVLGVENNGDAIACAQHNAQANRQTNASFMEADVEVVIQDLLKKQKPQGVLVNPPRQGLHPQVLGALKQNPPREVLYVSCMPATLARDLQVLSEKYQIKRCTAFDMFPQTGHVETLAVLKLASNSF